MALKDLDVKIRNASTHSLQKIWQVVTAVAGGIVLAHILFKIFNFGLLGYIFCLLLLSGSTYVYAKTWNFLTLTVFSLILLLSLLVLKSY